MLAHKPSDLRGFLRVILLVFAKRERYDRRMTRRSIEHNVHHARFPRVLHTADPINEAIREHPNNKFPLWLPAHEETHRRLIYTPPFPRAIGEQVLRHLELGADPGDKVDAFVYAVERAMRHPRTTPFDRQLGDLAITAMEIQRPLLISGEYPLDRLRAAV